VISYRAPAVTKNSIPVPKVVTSNPTPVLLPSRVTSNQVTSQVRYPPTLGVTPNPTAKYIFIPSDEPVFLPNAPIVTPKQPVTNIPMFQQTITTNLSQHVKPNGFYLPVTSNSVTSIYNPTRAYPIPKNDILPIPGNATPMNFPVFVANSLVPNTGNGSNHYLFKADPGQKIRQNFSLVNINTNSLPVTQNFIPSPSIVTKKSNLMSLLNPESNVTLNPTITPTVTTKSFPIYQPPPPIEIPHVTLNSEDVTPIIPLAKSCPPDVMHLLNRLNFKKHLSLEIIIR
jgi:hypothetical protein